MATIAHASSGTSSLLHSPEGLERVLGVRLELGSDVLGGDEALGVGIDESGEVVKQMVRRLQEVELRMATGRARALRVTER